MTRYKVESAFRDKEGRELRRATTFDGEEADAKCALVEAHGMMHTICSADPRIDMISSIVTGGTHRLCTTDYADELGCGMSSNGLMNEIDASRLDDAPDTLEADALDAVLTDEQKHTLIDEGKIKEVAAPGGSGNFPDDGRGVPGEAHPRAQGREGVSEDPAPSVVRPVQGSKAGSGAGPKGEGRRDGKAHRSVGGGPRPKAAHPVPQRPSVPKGAPYQGTDIIGDILRGQEELDRQLGPDRAPTRVRLGAGAWEALEKEMYKQHPGTKMVGPVIIGGIPVVRHDDPNMAPIQVEVGRKKKPTELSIPTPCNRKLPFATGGLVKGPIEPWLAPGEHLLPIPNTPLKPYTPEHLEKILGQGEIKITSGRATGKPTADQIRKLRAIARAGSHKYEQRFIHGTWADELDDDNE